MQVVIREQKLAALSTCRHRAKSRPNGVDRQVHRHSDPRKQGPRIRDESRGDEAVRERLHFEIHCGKHEVFRKFDGKVFESPAFPLLARGLIELEDAEPVEQVGPIGLLRPSPEICPSNLSGRSREDRGRTWG